MTASMLGETMGVKADTGLAGQMDARDLPQRSTRELEAVFAKRDGRRPLLGLTFAVTFSAAVWAGLAAILI